MKIIRKSPIFLKVALVLILGYLGQHIINKEATFLVSFTFTDKLDNFLRAGGNLDNVVFGFIIWIVISYWLFKILDKDRIVEFYGKILEKKIGEQSINVSKRKKILLILSLLIFLGFSVGFIGFIVLAKLQKIESEYLPIFFFTALSLEVSVFWIIDKFRNKVLLKLAVLDIFILAILALLTFILLGYNLRFPKESVADEAASWETVRGILKGEYKNDMFSYGYYSYPVFNAYFQANILRLFQLTNSGIVGWRFTAVPIAVLAVLGTYILTLIMFNRSIALVAALVLLVNPAFMILSRISIPTNQSVIAPLFTSLFLYSAFKYRSFVMSALAGIASGFGFYVYPPGKIGALIGGLYLIYIFFSRRKNKEMLFLIAVYIFSFLLTTTPIFTESFFINPQVASERIYETSSMRVANIINFYPEVSEKKLSEHFPIIRLHPEYTLALHPIVLQLFIRNFLVSFISLFKKGFFGGINFDSSMVGIEWGYFVFLGLFLSVFHFIRKYRDEFFLLIIWFLSCFLFFGVFWGVSVFWRLQTMFPTLAIFSAIAIFVIYKYLYSQFKRLTLVIFIPLFLLLFTSSYLRYFNEMYHADPDSEKFRWDLGYAVNDARKGEVVCYIYNREEGLKTGSGISFNYLHLSDSRYCSIPSDNIQNEIINIRPKSRYIFFYDRDGSSITSILKAIFGENGKLKVITSKQDKRVLYNKFYSN